MPQIPVPGTYRIVCRSVRGSEEIVNVFHTSFLDNDEAERLAVADAFSELYTGGTAVAAPGRGINDLLDDGVMLDTVTVQDISAVPYDDPTTVSYGVSGSLSGDSLPLSTTVNIQWRTAVASRNSRGRTFLGGFTESMIVDAAGQSNPLIQGANLVTLGNAVTDLFARLALIPGVDLVVASLFDGIDEETGEPIPRVAGVTFVVTSGKVANKFGTQRRRANKQLATDNVVINA